MTLHNSAVTLGTAAQLVVPGGTSPVKVYLHNMEHNESKTIYVGSSNITSSNAPHLDSNGTIYLTLNRAETLYALSIPSGAVLGVIYQTMEE